MNLKHLKITVILLILFGLFHSSCQLNEFDTSFIFEDFNEIEYDGESVFCQSKPDNEIGKKTFERDAKGNITYETYFENNHPYRKIIRTFNNGRQINDSVFYFSEGFWTLENSHFYKYEQNDIVGIQLLKQDGTVSHKTVYKYKNGKPLWEEFWYFDKEKWKFQYAHRFEFNRSGKLTKKESFQTEQKNEVYDTINYTYKNGKPETEKRIIRTGATSWIKEFTYTSDGLPDETIQDGNVIEKNFYQNSRLTEKHTFYFGIDPGFSRCNGNLIYRYKY
jgi:hypothetical protein